MGLSGLLNGLEASFSAKVGGANKAAGRGNGGPSQSADAKADGPVAKEIAVIGAQRAQNLTIALRRLGRPSAEAVAGAVLTADLDFLTDERVDLLQRLALEPDELAGVRAAGRAAAGAAPVGGALPLDPRGSGGDQGGGGSGGSAGAAPLRPLEAFLLTLNQVPRLAPKLACVALRHGSGLVLAGANKEVGLLAGALAETRRSIALPALLRLALLLSNFMNAGTGRVARAIKLSSLEKFALMKGAPPAPPGDASSDGKGPGGASAAGAGLGDGAPAYASKTLMHFLAYFAAESYPEVCAMP